jgi:predicted Rossmann-fold nucleotide-binding protein
MTTTVAETPLTISQSVSESDLIKQGQARHSLRVCCYGSSSSETPQVYLQQARDLGYLLGRRGHVCVNGAGSFGCMAALNDGALEGNGHIVGVIHEMWLVDQGDYKGLTVRDGGAHAVFDGNDKAGPIREIKVASGNDLQERKRLLVEGADALVVLPGGPGTWDEVRVLVSVSVSV